MATLLLALVLQTPATGEKSELVAIPATERPVDPLPELKGVAILSRNGYTMPGYPMVGRVYRYSVHEELGHLLARLKKSRPASQGWKVTRSDRSGVMFERTSGKGKLAGQVFLMQRARIVADPKGRVGIRVIPAAKAPGWTWVSYNEHLRK